MKYKVEITGIKKHFAAGRWVVEYVSQSDYNFKLDDTGLKWIWEFTDPQAAIICKLKFG
jgi:hypothetical protein